MHMMIAFGLCRDLHKNCIQTFKIYNLSVLTFGIIITMCVLVIVPLSSVSTDKISCLTPEELIMYHSSIQTANVMSYNKHKMQ